jgi:hypothetical protein
MLNASTGLYESIGECRSKTIVEEDAFLHVRDQVSHPYVTTGKIIILCILIFTFLTADENTDGSGLNGSKHCQKSIPS